MVHRNVKINLSLKVLKNTGGLRSPFGSLLSLEQKKNVSECAKKLRIG